MGLQNKTNALTLAKISSTQSVEMTKPMLSPWMPCRKMSTKISSNEPLFSSLKTTNANVMVIETVETTARKHVNM